MATWIVGNWKMNGSMALLDELIPALASGLPASLGDVKVGVCPPYPYLSAAAQRLNGTPIALGAQNVYPEASGAFTGEVAPAMLAEVGATLCIVGHSERRALMGEKDDFIAAKLKVLLSAGLTPIFCVGETLDEREADRHESVVGGQISAALAGMSAQDGARLIVAYEPVWAIGTGKTATPEQANAMHTFIRGQLSAAFDEATARVIPIQYGGSVNDANAAELLGQPEINGALVGGASLKAPAFLSIIQQALT